MTPAIWYCYDAYCGWCYGFSPVIKKLYDTYGRQMAFEALSGGMVLSARPAPIKTMAGYIAKAYKTVEDTTGVQFGQDYLWHIFNPDLSDWFPDSLKPAVAMSVFKQYYPLRSIEWAADLQYALHYEGRDLTDNEAYRHLLEKYEIPAEAFYEALGGSKALEEARYEFQLVKQLQVTGYPTVLMQTGEQKFFMIARGYTPYHQVAATIEKILEEAG